MACTGVEYPPRVQKTEGPAPSIHNNNNLLLAPPCYETVPPEPSCPVHNGADPMSLPLLYYVRGVSPSVPQWLPINFRTISSLVEKLLGNQMGAAREHPPKSNNFRPWH